ncbi:MAG TPA: ion transporter [Candidatus Limnocylindrales bacterium]|nr:ion transporter [Candidatus Limnocylindrales bacterium]
MVTWARQIVASGRFQTFIVTVIVINAVLVGLETSDDLVTRYADAFQWLNIAISAIFVVEITLRLITYWPRPQNFFRDGWNVFDFVIVGLSLLPVGGNFATVARLARLLRVVRLVSVLPELRLIVGTMLRSLGSMVGVILLLGLVMYVYAILGYNLFATIDPAHWGDLGISIRSLFEMLTLEGWLELQAAVIDQVGMAWLFFGSYILIAVFIVVNLFIAVILNNLETVKAEQVAEEMKEPDANEDLLLRVEAIRFELGELESRLRAKAEQAGPARP